MPQCETVHTKGVGCREKRETCNDRTFGTFSLLALIRPGIYSPSVSSTANFTVRNVRNVWARKLVLILMCQNTAYDSYRKSAAFSLLAAENKQHVLII